MTRTRFSFWSVPDQLSERQPADQAERVNEVAEADVRAEQEHQRQADG
jgi:hypothetical protein